MNPSEARRPSLLERMRARLGRSLVAWGDPFLFESGPRCSDRHGRPASREETAAVAAALARLAGSESSLSGMLPAPASATVNDCRG